jgi:hypothetical protein
MRSLKVTFCAGAAATVAALAPAAYAADAHGVSVTPSTPTPGTDVALRVSGCTGTTATAASAAFVTDAHLAGAGAEATLVGETRVRSSAPAGSYDVEVTCAESHIKGSITVVAKASGEHAPQPSTHASPVAPVHAGGGGTAHLSSSVADTSAADSSVADTRAAGPGTAQAVTGLVLAGVAAIAVVLRTARRSRGAD